MKNLTRPPYSPLYSLALLLHLLAPWHFASASPIPKGGAGTIEIDRVTTGNLTKKDARSTETGAPYKSYRVRLERGYVVSILVTSGDFSPNLTLVHETQGLIGKASNDQQPGDTSQLLHRVLDTGWHFVTVSGSEPESMGLFDLRVNKQIIDLSIVPGSYIQAAVGGDGPEHPELECPTERFLLEVEEDSFVSVLVGTAWFTPMISIAKPGVGNIPLFSSPHPSRYPLATRYIRTSRLGAQLEAGTYEIWVAAVFSRPGLFQMRVDVDPISKVQDVITIGEPLKGFVGPDKQAIPGSDMTGVPSYLSIDEGRRYRMRLESQYAGLFAVVQNEEEEILRTATITRNSRTVALYLSPGRYTIWTGLGDKALYNQARYSLIIEPSTGFRASNRIQTGENQSGKLEESYALCPRRNARVSYFLMPIFEKKQVQIDLHSPVFDAFLVLENEEGYLIEENDDAGPDTTNSRIIRELDPGVYRVGAAALDDRGWGSFELSVKEVE